MEFWSEDAIAVREPDFVVGFILKPVKKGKTVVEVRFDVAAKAEHLHPNEAVRKNCESGAYAVQISTCPTHVNGS